METLESILVGIDGSERGKKALKWAARLANREGAHLTLLAVIDPASNELVGSAFCAKLWKMCWARLGILFAAIIPSWLWTLRM